MRINVKYLTLKKLSASLLLAIIFLCYWFCLPNDIFKNTYSTVVEDKNGHLLSATIADDGQWRFPPSDSIPYKFKTAIRLFEDEYFYSHFGVNPISIFRALKQNFKYSKIRSGGSTITMQLIRLSRRKKRSYTEKIKEIILATRTEFKYSKNEIFNLYASNAPYGGNVVGLEAASWRYYGRAPYLLSWAETATLAVLPNAPSLIYPGKNQNRLLEKRNRLLKKIMLKGFINQEEYELSIIEPLPQKPHKLPQKANHFLQFAIKSGFKGERLISSIDEHIQDRINQIALQHYNQLSLEQIDNLAILILDAQNGKVLSYIGNSNCASNNCGGKVDIIQSKRSTGSTLKPFLYGFMMEEGMVLQEELVEDIPTKIADYSPENFDRSFDGAVKLNNALTRSLNIPAVRLLQEYGLEKFHTRLKKLGFNSINKGPNHYGLSIILGGSECTLWELSRAYYLLSRKAENLPINEISIKEESIQKRTSFNYLSSATAYVIANMITDTKRPLGEGDWKTFSSAKKIGWKTGTSFGHRDAWSVGITPEYVVGVWVGNADGEGRPGLTGVKKAGPIMFNVFRTLEETSWYAPPDDLINITVCEKSGYPASDICPKTKNIYASPMSIEHQKCLFHQKIHLDSSGQFRVTSKCHPVYKMINKTYFTLPTLQEWYYKFRNPNYNSLPNFLPGCVDDNQHTMAFIYPKDENTSIFIPKDLEGKESQTIFHVAHKDHDAILYWFLDDKFLGKTISTHKIAFNPNDLGLKTISVMDQFGNVLRKKIEFLSD